MSARASARGSKPERCEPLGIGERDALHPLHRHHFARRAVPVDRRRADVGVVLRVLGEFRRRRRLEAEVHLHAHRARQRLDDLDEAQAAQLRRDALGEPRGEEHVLEVAGEALLDARAQHLHGDRRAVPRASVDRGAVDLRDRGRRDRLAELGEQRVDLRAEGRLDDGDRRLAAHRRHAVLQALEFERDLGPDDVGAGRQELAHLDVGGPEPVDGARQPGEPADVAPGDEVGERERQARAGRQERRVDVDERAFAREDEAGAREPQAVADRGDDRHGSELPARMDGDHAAAELARSPTRAKPASAIMSANSSAEGNLRIEFDEIAIGRAVARDHLADRRNGGEGIGVVDAVEDGQVDVREFEAEEPAAAPQHAIAPPRAPSRSAARCGCRRRSYRRRTRRRRTAAPRRWPRRRSRGRRGRACGRARRRPAACRR